MCVTPRKASTIPVIKDNSGKIEVLIMKRHLKDRFLPDYHVFPGGGLDEQDYDYLFPEVQNVRELHGFDGVAKKYYAHIMCGIRETFEEAGLLFAQDEKGNYPVINTPAAIEKFSLYRKQVFEKNISFREMLEKENLYPAVNNFFFINRWITPAIFPIRYDASFFTVIAPEKQEISHDGSELVDFEWVIPYDALMKYREKKIKLVMPTIKTLEFLSEHKTAADVINSFSF